MRNLTEHNLTDAVLARLQECDDPRLKQVMDALIRHLHAFVREIEPTPDEWMAGIQFLTATGHQCDNVRQEFILLSDTLGVSILMDAINNRKPAGATESSVLGPFYQDGAPEQDTGADLAPGEGPGVVVSGRVTDLAGRPLANAVLDVWQTAPNGLYHMQDSGAQAFHLCGKVHTAADGSYCFRTLKPVSYAIPTDGPVGHLLGKLGRHPYRPAHIHFIVSAPGFKPVVTQLFAEGDSYLESDAVFGVKHSLVVDIERDGDEWKVAYDFVLEPVA
ncbi:MAG: intradiol ring-cleavage dioxygenase [Burkholderiaceae bacterium]|nr:intradiol ring-cleavage dioxygenase [Burkholderiaceae bacterium]